MKSQWPTVDNYVRTRSEYFGVRVQGLRDIPDNESYCSAVIFKTLYKSYAVIRCSSQCVIVHQSINQLINQIKFIMATSTLQLSVIALLLFCAFVKCEETSDSSNLEEGNVTIAEFSVKCCINNDMWLIPAVSYIVLNAKTRYMH